MFAPFGCSGRNSIGDAALALNATEQFSATALDVDGKPISNPAVTWTSSQPNIATIDPTTGLATAVSPGPTQITATSDGVTDFMFLFVQGMLKGQYAFLVQGFDNASGGEVAIIGSFVADGKGNITGLEDIVDAAGYSPSVTFSGTYSFAYGRGQISITNTRGTAQSFSFAAGSFSGGVATVGRMVEFDNPPGTGTQRGAGAFYLQDTSSLDLSSINGPYALQFVGQRSAVGSWQVNTGAFVADGRGSLNNGEFDTNSPSAGAPQTTAFTATLTANRNTSNFGQATLTFTSGVSLSGVVYIVSPKQALFMETDLSGLAVGQILAQTTTSFSDAQLSGITVEYEQGLGSSSGQPSAGIGLINFSGGTATVTRDYADSNAAPSSQSFSLSYSSVAPNGRAALNGTLAAIVYLVDLNKGFIMSSTDSATAGFFEPQAPLPKMPFEVDLINGMYFGGTVPPSIANASFGLPAVNDVEFLSPHAPLFGSQNPCYTEDLSRGNTSFRNFQIAGGELGVSWAVDANGRGHDGLGNVYYLVSPSKFLMLAVWDSILSPLNPVLSTPPIDVLQQ